MNLDAEFVPTYDAAAIARAIASPLLILAGFAVLVTVNLITRQPRSSPNNLRDLRAFGLVFPGLVVGGFFNAVLAGEDAKTDRAFLLALIIYPVWTPAVLGLLFAFITVVERHTTRAPDFVLTLALIATWIVGWLFYYITAIDYLSVAINLDIPDFRVWDWIWPAAALFLPGSLLAGMQLWPKPFEGIFRDAFDSFQVASLGALLLGSVAFAAVSGFAPAFHRFTAAFAATTLIFLFGGSLLYAMYGLAIWQRKREATT